MVSTGVVRVGALFEVTRARSAVGAGIIINVQQRKADAKEVRAGQECGLAADVEGKLEEGDVLVLYSEKEV